MLANHWCASVDATIQLRTGCNPLEKHGPQAVLVHADAWAPMDAVANPHDIRDVVDYEVIFLQFGSLKKMTIVFVSNPAFLKSWMLSFRSRL